VDHDAAPPEGAVRKKRSLIRKIAGCNQPQKPALRKERNRGCGERGSRLGGGAGYRWNKEYGNDGRGPFPTKSELRDGRGGLKVFWGELDGRFESRSKSRERGREVRALRGGLQKNMKA